MYPSDAAKYMSMGDRFHTWSWLVNGEAHGSSSMWLNMPYALTTVSIPSHPYGSMSSLKKKPGIGSWNLSDTILNGLYNPSAASCNLSNVCRHENMLIGVSSPTFSARAKYVIINARLMVPSPTYPLECSKSIASNGTHEPCSQPSLDAFTNLSKKTSFHSLNFSSIVIIFFLFENIKCQSILYEVEKLVHRLP